MFVHVLATLFDSAGKIVFVKSLVYLFVYFFLMNSYASHQQYLPIKCHTLGHI